MYRATLLSSRFVVALALLLAASTPLRAQRTDSVVVERGRQLTDAFYDGALDLVLDVLHPTMLSALGGEEGLTAFRGQVLDQLGSETAVLDEAVTSEGGLRVYRRSASFEGAPGAVAVVWAFDDDEAVAGFTIRPEEAAREPTPSPHLDRRTRTPLRLPFQGEWTVFWGGRTLAQNYHAATSDQRFAYDFVVEVDGRTHRGPGTANEDYHCFGRPVLAPAPGVTVSARDGVADNVPGWTNPEEPAGNHVVIDHGDDEHSVLAHLRKGSLRVGMGETVAAGDTVGLCGNSGNSSEPHLHYHLQDSPAVGNGEGLPAQFLHYLADDEPVARGEPARGQRIRRLRTPG